ncbi:hypothetical protein BGX27_001273 [Mortierella sp. AM989]|nr:hypothetical protein BGX27_001273 [Mortierella sp. AM989]
MEHLDQSLEHIIKTNKQAQRKTKDAAKKPRPKAPIKTTKTGRIVKSTPRIVKTEKPLFTETYRALTAPIKEIFTSRYIPQTGPIKLTTFNTKAIQAKKSVTLSNPVKPIRLVTTQKIYGSNNNSRDSSRTGSPASQKSSLSNSNPREVFRTADHYRPGPRRDSERHRSRSRDDSTSTRKGTESKNHASTNQGNNSMAGSGIDSIRKANNNSINHNNNNNNNSNKAVVKNSNSNSGGSKGKNNSSNNGRDLLSTHHKIKPESEESTPEVISPEMSMDLDDGPLSIKGAAPSSSDSPFQGESGPVTIEIENLDPGTTSEDVKVVCSRFGEIKSCICSDGYSQVTFARRAAGLAAVETLNGKKADNNQILRVSMRKTPVIHNVSAPAAATHAPSAIAGPMKMLSKAVEGTIKNAGSLYQEQLQAAQHMLKVQQHRMAQLHLEEQRIAALRMQANAQYGDLNGVAWPGGDSSSSGAFFNLM